MHLLPVTLPKSSPATPVVSTAMLPTLVDSAAPMVNGSERLLLGDPDDSGPMFKLGNTTSVTSPVPWSTTNTSPFPSAATAAGSLKPLPKLLMVGEEGGMPPPTATISCTKSLPESATYTFPPPSTATAAGSLKPLPRVRMVGEEEGMPPPAATISCTLLLPKSATYTSPLPS